MTQALVAMLVGVLWQETARAPAAASSEAVTTCARLVASTELADSAPATESATSGWQEHFIQGVRAIDRVSYRAAVHHFCAALAERPHDDATKVNIFSNRYVTYVPSMFLAIALVELGRCADAQTFFDTSAAQNVAPERESDRFRSLVAARERCSAAN